MLTAQNDLWSIVQRPYVDADVPAHGIFEHVLQGDLDYRSPLLVRDRVNAVKHPRGGCRLSLWLASFAVHQQFDCPVILDRLKRDCQSMLANESLKNHATNNWYILTGDRLVL